MKTETAISLQQYLDMGGVPEKGLKLFTRPELDILMCLPDKKFYSENSTEFTFIEYIPGKGVKVEEKEKLLGTAWLFLITEVELFSERQKIIDDFILYMNEDYSKFLALRKSNK